MPKAGAFSIQRLEVSWFGIPTLWVLNCVVGRGTGGEGRWRSHPEDRKTPLGNAAMRGGGMAQAAGSPHGLALLRLRVSR